MFGRLAVQGPKRGGRPATSWVDCPQKNLEAFGAVPCKDKNDGRKWVAYGVAVKDRQDWMAAAKNVGMYVCMVITYYSRVWINRVRLRVAPGVREGSGSSTR